MIGFQADISLQAISRQPYFAIIDSDYAATRYAAARLLSIYSIFAVMHEGHIEISQHLFSLLLRHIHRLPPPLTLCRLRICHLRFLRRYVDAATY
jgi:hypothetical protein